MPLTEARWHRTIEDRIYQQQYRAILAKCGKKAAEMANYGWGVSSDTGYVGVATKVYGHGVLESEGRRGRGGGWGRIEHDWR